MALSTVLFALLMTRPPFAAERDMAWSPNVPKRDRELGSDGPWRAAELNGAFSEISLNTMVNSAAIQRAFYSALPKTLGSEASASCYRPWEAWASPFFRSEEKLRREGYNAYRENTIAVGAGIRRHFGNSAAFGVAVGMDHRLYKEYQTVNQRNRGNSLHAMLHGEWRLGDFTFAGYAGYSHTSNRRQREGIVWNTGEPIQGVDGPARSRNSVNAYTAGLNAQRHWNLAGMTLRASVGMEVARTYMGAFAEQNRLLPDGSIIFEQMYAVMRSDSTHYTSLAIPLLLSLRKEAITTSAAFSVEARGGYIAKVGARRAKTTQDTRWSNNSENLSTIRTGLLNSGHAVAGLSLATRFR